MNRCFQRNPERLIRLWGPPGENAPPCPALPRGLPPAPLPLRSRAAEEAFRAWLEGCPTEDLRPLTLILGGFVDACVAQAYAVAALWPPELAVRQDVYYREHPEGRDALDLVRFYAGRGLPVIVVGFSWGGDTAVHAVARRTNAPIDLLVTLDPVSRKGPPRAPLPHVRHWVNVCLDYAKASWRVRSNLIARIGGPWGPVAVAQENHIADPTLTHAQALDLFQGYALDAVRGAASRTCSTLA